MQLYNSDMDTMLQAAFEAGRASAAFRPLRGRIRRTQVPVAVRRGGPGGSHPVQEPPLDDGWHH